MSARLLIPTCLTFSTLREGITAEAVTAINGFLTAQGLSTLPSDPAACVGLQNPFVLSLNDFDMGGAAFLRTNEMAGLASCGPIDNFDHMPTEYVSLIVAVGGDLEGYPVWFEIDDPTALCPFAPDDLVDEEGNPIPQETWETWGTSGESHKPVQHGAKWYRSSAVGYSGELMKASQWVNMPGLTVKTRQEYLAIAEANAPEV